MAPKPSARRYRGVRSAQTGTRPAFFIHEEHMVGQRFASFGLANRVASHGFGYRGTFFRAVTSSFMK